jgi:hypothetical protein
VHGAHRERHVTVPADHADPDLGRGDDLDVDAGVGQGAEECRRDARVRTLPMCSSNSSRSKPTRALIFSSAASAAGPSERGTVKEMSVRFVEAADTFWTIMSMLTSAPAIASKMLAASPGLSGTPTTVTFASLVSWATPEMIACSMPSSGCVALMMVPGLCEYEERTTTGTA